MNSTDKADTFRLGNRDVKRIGYGAMQLAGVWQLPDSRSADRGGLSPRGAALGRFGAASGSYLPPGDAPQQWLLLSANYIATQKGLASAVGLIVNHSSGLSDYSIGLLTNAVTWLVNRATASSYIREVANPIDLLRAGTGGLLRRQRTTGRQSQRALDR